MLLAAFGRYLDGKFDSSSAGAVAHKVRTAVSAIVAPRIT
jgi:hypothetical protein